MWDTKQSDYNIMNTPYGKDVLKSLAKACDKNDLKLHLYYSHIDWTREDYPAGRTGRGTGKNPANENWGQYYKFMNDQLTELLTNYGPIGAIWFDGWWDHDQDSVAFDWQLPEQYELIHRLQPSCLVANNHHQTPFEGEDIQIFERDVPGENHAGLSGQSISRLPLETCQTMNGMWGYKVTDTNYKSFNQLVQLLVKTASKGGNLLLNVGPQPNGELPAMAVTRLKELGQWLKVNGKAIYKTTAGNIKVGEHIVSTTGEEGTYLHLLSDTISTVEIPVSHKVKRVTTFPEGQRLKHTFKNGVLSFEVAIPKGCPDYIVEIK
jgi:alpha-L-fucosidase